MSEQARAAACAHDKYWTTVYGNCMACRADNAESQLESMNGHEQYIPAGHHIVEDADGERFVRND